MSLRDITRELLTESDNVTHDLYRYLAVCSIVTGLSLQVYAIGWKGQPFDMQTFGIGVGALFAGVGVALGLKKESGQNG
jgi:hypothetical protein